MAYKVRFDLLWFFNEDFYTRASAEKYLNDTLDEFGCGSGSIWWNGQIIHTRSEMEAM